MKIQKILLGVIAFMCCNMGFAQISGINYKAVIKDNSGNPVVNTTIQVRFSIIQETGFTTIYVEDHNPTTDDNGIVMLNIGEGSTISGNINIDGWGSDNHFLFVQIDIGSGLVNMGTTQFKSVPYAWFAQNSGDHLGDTWIGTGSLSINTNVSSSGALNINNSGTLGDGIQIDSASDQGVSIGSAGDDGVYVDSAGSTGFHVNSATNGVIVSSASVYGVYVNSAGTSGFHVTSAGANGITVVSAEHNGGFFRGDITGVHAESINDANPDIILGGTSGSDDGIISSDPAYTGSDIFLKSNDAVVVRLDQDNNSAGGFQVRDGLDDVVFEVFESGTIQQNDVTIHASDRRLKKDIEDLPYGLDEILQLKPKAYNWKNKEQQHKSLGLIAQDVQPIISEIVTARDDALKTLGISYTELIPVLIKAIQEQNTILNQQKQENATLKSQIFQRLERLEASNNH